MRTAPEVVALAVRGALVSTDDVLTGRVVLLDRSRSNLVHVVLVDGEPLAYVKQRGAASLLDGDDATGNERRALRHLEGLDVAPDLVLDGDAELLWVGATPGIVLTEAQGSVPRLVELCGAWGRALARLHRWPVPEGPVPEGPVPTAPRPWALQPDDLPPSMAHAEAPQLLAVLEACAEGSLGAAATVARDGWTEGGWMHGDVSPSNVLVGEGAPPTVGFVDFEGAGLGDPGWDVVTAIDSLEWIAGSWNAPPEPLVEHFLEGYRTAGGPGRASPALHAVRSVMTAWQVAAQSSPEPSAPTPPDVLRLLHRAREHAAEVARSGRAPVS